MDKTLIIPQFDIELHKHQWEVFLCPARFRVLVAGRRFGKTHLALTEMIVAAQAGHKVVWYVAPTDHQAKNIAWVRLKEMTRPFWVKRPNETEMRIETCWGSTLVVTGAFFPDTLRGQGVDFLVVDEAANIKPEAWPSVFRPALADRQGRALFIGTPQGRNHFYYLYEFAKTDPDWAAFQYSTAQGGLVTASELESAARQLDEQTFKQEFGAQFATVGQNRVYFAFDSDLHVKSVSLDGYRPLVWSIDFNVDPMCMLIMQKVDDTVNVLEEIVIKNCHTALGCEKFLERADHYYHQLPSSHKPLVIRVYGDATGNNRRTAGAQTDWAIVQQCFEMWRGTYQAEFFVRSANPPVRDRVNLVNSRLRNTLEDNRLFVDPKCKELIRDLEDVTWVVDSVGTPTTEIGKTDKLRTHTSDALGYFISQAFPMTSLIGHKGDGPILSF